MFIVIKWLWNLIRIREEKVFGALECLHNLAVLVYCLMFNWITQFITSTMILWDVVWFLDVSIGEKALQLVKIYAPNVPAERHHFFNLLDHHLSGHHHVILAWDFNCVKNSQLDKIGGNPDCGTKSVDILKNAYSSFQLVDPF